MSLSKQFVRYLKAVELVGPEVCDLHRGEAGFQVRYMLVSVFALLKDGEKQDFKQEFCYNVTLVASASSCFRSLTCMGTNCTLCLAATDS